MNYNKILRLFANTTLKQSKTYLHNEFYVKILKKKPLRKLYLTNSLLSLTYCIKNLEKYLLPKYNAI